MTITTVSTLIAASPTSVRAVFLDFPNLSKWDTSYLKTITPLLPSSHEPDPTKTSGFDVVPGDRMHGTFWGGEAYLLVLDNSERRLRWEGTWKGMKAVRSFEFMDAGDGMTRFTQSEEATGFMGFVLQADSFLGDNLKKKFAKCNDDLKVFCEKSGN